MSTDQDTLLKRGKVDGQECLRVMNRTNGKVVADIESFCNHNPALLVSSIHNSNTIFEFCAKCNEIRVYNICNIVDRQVICKKCTPRGMCSGPDNTLFVMDGFFVIWHFEWNCGDTNLKVVRKVRSKLANYYYLLKMCHSAVNHSLIVASLSISMSVDAVSLADGSCLWTLSRSNGGFEIHPYGVCCNPTDGCIFICNRQGNSVYMLDPFTGHILQVIPIIDAFVNLLDLCWSNSQPHLTVLGTNKEETEFIGCFNVEDYM